MATPSLRRDLPHAGGSARRGRAPTTKPVAKPIAAEQSNAHPVTRIVLLTLLLSSVMIFGASRMGPVWSQMIRQQVAAREMAELESLENEALSTKFDAWLARGNEGLQWTVAALASARPGVSFQAEQALLRESDTWRIRGRSDAAERIVVIAQSLARVAKNLPAARRPGVRRLVERFASWPIDDAIAARELTAACDAIIARLPPASDEELQLAERELSEQRVARALEPISPIPTDPLPEALPPIIKPSELEPQPPANLPSPEPEGPPPPAPTKQVPKRFFAPRANELPPIADKQPVEAAPAVIEPPQKNLNEWMRMLADLEVMRMLHHSDYGVRFTAEKELSRRGYAAEHLPLARQLIHPDPRERRKLAEQLPRLSNVDPRPWLLQLAEDDDQDVRRTAAGILQAARPGREPR